MTPQEVARICAAITAYDQRTFGDADTAVWEHQLADLNYLDALNAVHRWYRENRVMARVADIRALAAEFEADRRAGTRSLSASDTACWMHGKRGCKAEYCAPAEPWECLFQGTESSKGCVRGRRCAPCVTRYQRTIGRKAA